MASMAETLARRLAAWPDRYDAMGVRELLQVGRVERWLVDEGAENDAVIRHAYLTVREDSTAAEKERYQAALTRRRDQLDAAALWREWCRTSGRHSTIRRAWRRRKQRRRARRMRKQLDRTGDPTASGWRPDRRARRSQWLAAHGALPPPKPPIRTVYVPLRASEYWPDREDWIPVLASVSTDNIAVLPQVRTFADQWPFPPGARVQCEWRERQGRPALHAIALAD